MNDFSVLMSVYRNDKPEYIVDAIESVTINQIIQPNELILVIDGPLPLELECCVRDMIDRVHYIKPLWKNENQGLGLALRDGVMLCSNEIIARMDSDDIAVPDRFNKQLSYLYRDPSLSLIGSNISEFIDNTSNVVGQRVVSQFDSDIKKNMKFRCPLNHMTVMFRKSHVVMAGNYQQWFLNEDYYLWIRMLLAGCKFANINENLVNVRVGKDMYARRGGWKYFKSEIGIQLYMLKKGLITPWQYMINSVIRFLIQVISPNLVRAFIFKHFLRK